MLSNDIVAVVAGLVGSTAGLGVPMLEIEIQPPFSPFRRHEESIFKRDGDCPEGSHPCSDLNSTLCCPNSDYCVVNEDTLQVQCCLLGSTCGSTCGQDEYYSASTTTGTAGGTVTTGIAGACVARPCFSTNYLCPRSMGGNCCAFGQNCATSGQCLDFGLASTMSSCTSGLFNCGMDTQETRCCPTGAACTSASPSGYYCVSSVSAQPAIPTTTSSTVNESEGNDNVALKIGLGVGIPGGLIAIAVIAFGWRIRRAKTHRNHASENDEKEGYSKPELAADSIAVPVELDAGAPELPAQILEAELPEEGVVAELPGGAPSQIPGQSPGVGRA